MELIHVQDITKTYKLRSKELRRPGFSRRRAAHTEEVHAIRGINFAVQPGEIVGYIGKNGAGKSTTIKILSGILVPSAGEVRVNGIVPYKQRIQNARQIGVVFGQRTQLYWDLPVADSFIFLRKLYQVGDAAYQEMMDYFDTFFHLRELLRIPVRKLSLGQRMKCDLCASLLHNPPIVYLDEPTIGLDLITKKMMREFILKINRERGTTILITTHDLIDIEQLSSRLIIIDKGQKMYDGLPDGVQSHLRRKRLVKVLAAEPMAEPAEKGVYQCEVRGNQLHCVIDLDEISIADFIRNLSQTLTVNDLTVHELNLEQLLFDYYREETGSMENKTSLVQGSIQ